MPFYGCRGTIEPAGAPTQFDSALMADKLGFTAVPFEIKLPRLR